MILRVFAIYDSKAEAFLQPFFMRQKGEAIRAFSDSVNDVKSNFNKYPEDFTLFEFGVFNDDSGVFEMLPTGVSVIKAIEVIKRDERVLN